VLQITITWTKVGILHRYGSLCLEGVTEDCRSHLYGNVIIKKYTTRALLEFFKASFFPFCFYIFLLCAPSLVSANTPSLKANPQLCFSYNFHADDNFGLEAQYFQRFCQDRHKCQCES